MPPPPPPPPSVFGFPGWDMFVSALFFQLVINSFINLLDPIDRRRRVSVSP